MNADCDTFIKEQHVKVIVTRKDSATCNLPQFVRLSKFMKFLIRKSYKLVFMLIVIVPGWWL